MFAWIALVRALVALAAAIVTRLQQRQWIEAGRAIEIAKSLELARGRIDEALAARRAARIRDADPAGLRDDDGFRRQD
jgi:hypothetical protein